MKHLILGVSAFAIATFSLVGAASAQCTQKLTEIANLTKIDAAYKTPAKIAAACARHQGYMPKVTLDYLNELPEAQQRAESNQGACSLLTAGAFTRIVGMDARFRTGQYAQLMCATHALKPISAIKMALFTADYYVDRSAKTPDLPQTTPWISNNGGTNCGPTAVSNGLIYLYNQGFKKLPSNKASLPVILANRFGTTTQGISPGPLMENMRSYLVERGYANPKFEFRGVRKLTTATQSYRRSAAVTPAWINASLKKHNTAMFVVVGWYKSGTGGNLDRVGGHWMTIVGAGVNDFDILDHNFVMLHDPAGRNDRADGKKVTHRVKLNKMTSGTLVCPRCEQTNANGLYRINEGYWKVKGTADFAVVEGVVRLEL